jgi:3-oxoacyl-[acyl-carrier protein] reductase
MKRFTGKVVLVTGGTRGLGAATALAFASEGANVAISYVASTSKAEQIVGQLRSLGVKAQAFRADQGDPKQVEDLISSVHSHFGALDILVNNAALSIPGRVDDPNVDPAALDRQYDVNFRGVVAAVRSAVRYLPSGGRIVTVGSGIATRVGSPGMADYAATKAAIAAFSKGAARDLGSKNITVNVVQSGIMDTDMAAPYKTDLLPKITSNLAIPRFGLPEEVAAGILFLASPEASYITGAILDIDGGYGA